MLVTLHSYAHMRDIAVHAVHQHVLTMTKCVAQTFGQLATVLTAVLFKVYAAMAGYG